MPHSVWVEADKGCRVLGGELLRLSVMGLYLVKLIFCLPFYLTSMASPPAPLTIAPSFWRGWELLQSQSAGPRTGGVVSSQSWWKGGVWRWRVAATAGPVWHHPQGLSKCRAQCGRPDWPPPGMALTPNLLPQHPRLGEPAAAAGVAAKH